MAHVPNATLWIALGVSVAGPHVGSKLELQSLQTANWRTCALELQLLPSGHGSLHCGGKRLGPRIYKSAFAVRQKGMRKLFIVLALLVVVYQLALRNGFLPSDVTQATPARESTSAITTVHATSASSSAA
jgi:hypothetical protein